MALSVAAKAYPQMFGGDFDFLHRLNPVSLVVMVRHREQSVRFPQHSRLGAVVSPARLSEKNAAKTHDVVRKPMIEKRDFMPSAYLPPLICQFWQNRVKILSSLTDNVECHVLALNCSEIGRA